MRATLGLHLGSWLILSLASAGCNMITGAGDLTVEQEGTSPGHGGAGGNGGAGGAGGDTSSTSTSSTMSMSSSTSSTSASSTTSASSSGAASSSSSSTSASSSSSSSSSTSASSSSSSSSTSSSGGDPLEQATQLCVDTINNYRATLGLPPYQRWNASETCAATEAQKDSTTMQAHSAFPSCSEWAQNECPGWPGPPGSMITGCLAQMWAEGPGDFNSGHGHYINMSSTQYTKVACGFHVLSNGKVWAVQDFQ